MTYTAHGEPVITSYAKAPARTITADGTTYAYRELGPKGGIPVIFFVHLAATLDNWDPRIVDPIAKTRHVIAFDNTGVGALDRQGARQRRGDGRRRLRLHQGARLRPDRHLLVLPRRHGRPGPDRQAPRARPQARADRHRAARRQGHRQGRRHDLLGHPSRDVDDGRIPRSSCSSTATPPASPPRRRSSSDWRSAPRTATRRSRRRHSRRSSRPSRSTAGATPSDLSKLTQPTLIANGDNDRMVPSVLSEDLHRRIAGSELVIYPDSGHGGIFQFHEQFAPVAVEFLNR